MQQGRAVGFGLIILGVVLGALVFLWLFVNAIGGQLEAGGLVLGLIILAVLALPPVGAGVYLLGRARQEEVEAAGFASRRRVFEADRLFRADVSREFRQLAERLEQLPGEQARRAVTRLRQIVEDLENPGISEASWYEAVHLEDRDLDALRAYDDLVSDGLRRLDALADDLEAGQATAAERLESTIRDVEDQLRLRQELLVRGRRAAAVSPTELLTARQAARGPGTPAELKVGDAITYEGEDYLVEATVTYFSAGRTWRIHRLGDGQAERWLYTSPAGLDLFMLEAMPAPEPGSESVERDGSRCRLAASGTASATVRTATLEQGGTSVDYWRYACPDETIVWVERWPDALRAYAGPRVRPSALEVWPRAQEAAP